MVSCSFVELVGEPEIPALLFYKGFPGSKLVFDGDGEPSILSDDLFYVISEAVIAV